jgi:polyisoprenoid-binding protein YceI
MIRSSGSTCRPTRVTAGQTAAPGLSVTSHAPGCRGWTLSTDVTATGDIQPDNPEASRVDVTIQMASITTNHQQRDNDLRSSNFLEVDAYPTATFTSTAVKQTGTDDFSVTGDLAIKGVTKPVTISLTRLGEFNDPAMGHRIDYSGSTAINRKDFGMSFNPVLDGRFVVSDGITISLEGELVEQPEEASAQAS